MKDLRGRNCTGAKAAGVKKQALDVDKMQSIKSIVLATYGKNKNLIMIFGRSAKIVSTEQSDILDGEI